MRKFLETKLKMYNLPISYAEITFEDTELTAKRKKDLPELIEKAPVRGILYVQGTAAPIVNQLLTKGKAVRGIDFTERSSSAFEQHQNPECAIVVIYNLGAEITVNYHVPQKVINNILKHYSTRDTLIIVETDLSKNDLLNRYDINAVNYIKIPRKTEERWI